MDQIVDRQLPCQLIDLCLVGRLAVGVLIPSFFMDIWNPFNGDLRVVKPMLQRSLTQIAPRVPPQRGGK